MDIDKRLLAVGEIIKAKGWESASVDIAVSYLALFGHEPSEFNPMISYRPSIRASTQDKYRAPMSHEFVRDAHGCKSIESALDKLEAAAQAMPTMHEETARIEAAKKKLSDEDKRLLGVY